MEMVPVALFPPMMPFTDHVTPELELGVTFAMNCSVWFSATVAELGDMLTLILDAVHTLGASANVVPTISVAMRL